MSESGNATLSFFFLGSVVVDKTLYLRTLGVGTTLVPSKTLSLHDKSYSVVPINLLQPHEHHGTIIHAELFLYTKPLKTKLEP